MNPTARTISSSTTTPKRWEALRELCKHFDRRGISYGILGDLDLLRLGLESDVDIVVSSSALPHLRLELDRFARTIGARLIQTIQHEPTAFFFVFSLDEAGEILLQVDLCSDYYRQGRRFLCAADLLKDRHCVVLDSWTSVRVPAPAAAFIYYLLKKVEKGELDGEHGNYLSAQWELDPEGAARQVERFWPPEEVRRIAGSAVSGRWGIVRESLPHLRRTLRTTRRRGLAEVQRRWRRIRQPAGFWVAFLGPDGSGKSTVIHAVGTRLRGAFWKTDEYHLRPHVGSRLSDQVPVTDPHGRLPRTRAASYAKLIYYLLDYYVGYAIRVRPQLTRATLVLFDRFLPDILADPLRYRYRGSTLLCRLAVRSIPQPDLYVVLDAPVDVLHARKREIEREESRRQREAYRALARDLPNGYLVDAARPLDEVVADVSRLIVTHLADRQARQILS